MIDEAVFIILFLNGANLLFYLWIESLINYIITIISRFFSKSDDEHLEKKYQKSIKNIRQLIIYRIITALIITIVIVGVTGVMGRYIYSYRNVVNIYFQFESLQVICAVTIFTISTFILTIINNSTCGNVFKFLFFISTSIVLQVNFLLFNTKAVLTF